MPRNFSLGKMKLTGVSIKDPRVAMRAIIGVLLAANLAAAVIAFKPFGGSAGDLRLEQAALGRQLTELEKRAGAARRRFSDEIRGRPAHYVLGDPGGAEPHG